MASAKQEAINRLGNVNDYIGLNALNKERQVAQDTYNTSTKSLQDEYNNLLSQIANDKSKTRSDFDSGRSTVAQNAYQAYNPAMSLARGTRGAGISQLNKVRNNMEVGRQNSNLANTFYNTMNEIDTTEKQGTAKYNLNLESANNTLQGALAGIGTREANARNAYNQAVANLAEQIQARRDANANAAAARALTQKQLDEQKRKSWNEALYKMYTNKGYDATVQYYKNYIDNKASDNDIRNYLMKNGVVLNAPTYSVAPGVSGTVTSTTAMSPLSNISNSKYTKNTKNANSNSSTNSSKKTSSKSSSKSSTKLNANSIRNSNTKTSSPLIEPFSGR